MDTSSETYYQREIERLMRIIKCLQTECKCVPPSITTQPTSRIIINEFGGAVTLTVVATGEGLVYQWKKDGEEIPGEILSTLLIDPFEEDDLGSYTVTVSNSCGSITSTTTLILQLTPLIIVYGAWLPIDTDVWTVLQTNDPYIYQWSKVIQHNEDICADYRPGSGTGNMEFILKVPKGESTKLSWKNTDFNYGDLTQTPEGDQAWHSKFSADYNNYDYYISRGDIGLDPNNVTCFRSPEGEGI